MAGTVRLKRSAVEGKIPTISDLDLGEIAINTFDGKAYIKKNNGTASIVEVGGGGFSGAYADLTGKPTLGTAAATDSTAYATSSQGTLADSATQPGDLATVATSGSYDDLTGKPTLGTAAATNSTAYATAAQGTAADSAVQPGDLATVATSGSYADLSNKPTIPAAVTNNNQLTNGAGYITSADGGNADTLDGIDSGSFLRSNANDTATGQITFSYDDDTNDFAQIYVRGSDNHSGIVINPVASKQAHLRFYDNGTEKWQWRVPFQDSSDAEMMLYSWNASSDLYKFNHNGTATFNGGTVWTSANDGSGSGLDADLLDGLQLTSASTASTVVARDPSGYIFSNYYNGTGTFSTSGLTSGMGIFTGTNGADTYGRSYTAAAARTLLNVENGATADQTAAEILTAIKTVDGSGTGLDADLLDGIDSGSFLRSDADDNTTGKLVIGGTYANNAYNSVSSTRLMFGAGDANAQSSYYIGTNLENYGGNYTKLDLRWHTGIRMGAQPAYGGTRIYNNEALTTLLFSVGRGDGNTRVESGSLLIGGNTAWHAGNDGSGTGLDADLLDGQQGSYYLDYNNFTNVPSSGGGTLQTVTDAGNSTTNQAFFGAGITVWKPANNTALTLQTPASNSNTAFLSGKSNTAFLGGSGTTKFIILADGSASFSGTVTATVVPPSDARFKENITPAKPQLADVVALGGILKNYDWNEDAPVNDELRAVRQLGLIAQEAEVICPGIVKDLGSEEDRYKGISQDALVMKLLGAVAELTARVTALESA